MKNTIILTVHNKEKTICLILSNLLKYTSNLSNKLIIILDGCTDESEKKVKQFFALNKTFIDIEIIFTDDIWETKANNVGLRNVRTKYATIVQDVQLVPIGPVDLTNLNSAVFLQASPNPANQLVNISYNSTEFTIQNQLFLWDELGRVVQKISLIGNSGSIELSTDHLPSGMYYYGFSGMHYSSCKKLMIAR